MPCIIFFHPLLLFLYNHTYKRKIFRKYISTLQKQNLQKNNTAADVFTQHFFANKIYKYLIENIAIANLLIYLGNMCCCCSCFTYYLLSLKRTKRIKMGVRLLKIIIIIRIVEGGESLNRGKTER